MVCLLAEAPLGDDYSLWILTQTSMSQVTVQQSYLLCWELLPDRNRKSMGWGYWELMSHPDPAVLPVGTLHSLEWFWVNRRIFVYSHHNTIVFFVRRERFPDICRRTHGGNGLKFYMLMYLGPFQNWLVYGHGLLTLLILALFWLSETGQLLGFRGFPGERIEGMAWNMVCCCILTTFRID